jgi:very-short-patch-repair endonuclease
MQWDETFYNSSKSQMAKEVVSLIKCNYEWYAAYKSEISDLIRLSNKCQSAGQSILFWQMVTEWNAGISLNDESNELSLMPSLPFINNKDVLDIEIQSKININNKEYKIDFLFVCYDSNMGAGVYYCVEVDNNDIQDIQIKRNKLRDEILRKAGYIVLRFGEVGISASPSVVLDKILSAIAE